MTVCPLTVTGSVTLASNVSPALLSRLETVVSSTTWISLPAGIVTGAWVCAPLDEAGALAGADEDDDAGVLAALLELPPLFEQPKSIASEKAAVTQNDKRGKVFTL